MNNIKGLVNSIKNNNIRFILNLIIKKGVKSLNSYQIVLLSEFLLNDSKDKLKTINILKELKIDFKKLYNEYLNIISLNDIDKSIDNDINLLNNIIKTDKNYYIGAYIDVLSKKMIDLIELNNLSNYIYFDINKYLKPIKKDLEFYLKQYLDTDSNKNTDNKELHKFIKSYDVFTLLDKIYTNNLNKKISIDFKNSKYDNLKDFISNSIGVGAFKIDNDLLKTNKFKLNRIDYIKIKITFYDTDKTYYLCNKIDLIDLNINYSYDFNNLISYLLDNTDKYYTIFNDKKLKTNCLKSKNFKGFNKLLSKKIKKTDLKVNSKFKYSNSYNTFYDLFELDLNLKYLDLDLDKYFKQLDLDLISIDNDLEYNKLLYSKYLELVNILYDLEYNDKIYYSKLEKNLLDSLIDLNIYNDYLEYDFTYLYHLDYLLIDFMNDYNTNSFILNDLNKSRLKDILHDIKTLNNVIDIIDNLFKELEYNDFYLKDKIYYDFNDKLKNHNTIFNTSITDFKKVSYNDNKFYITE